MLFHQFIRDIGQKNKQTKKHCGQCGVILGKKKTKTIPQLTPQKFKTKMFCSPVLLHG